MSTSIPTTQSTLSQSSNANLLTLPAELRRQIYHHAFSSLSLQPFVSATTTHHDCQRCQTTLTTPLPGTLPNTTSPFTNRHLFTSNFLPLLACRQIHTEASPIFYSTLTLTITSPSTLDQIRQSTPLTLRQKIHALALTVHLNDETRFPWYQSLRALQPFTFPNLTTLTVHNHMRSPISYDRLTDAIHLYAPLTSLPPSVNQVLTFAYTRDEIMFESPFLGDITTEDSLEAHEAVIRDLVADEGFMEGAEREDFDGMTGRLLFVARGHEERWLEGLQRRRLEGLSVREVRERVQRSVMGEVGMQIDDGFAGREEDEEEEGVWDE